MRISDWSSDVCSSDLIEEYLYSHPDVTDVAVIGVSDPKLGEAVCAWIVRAPGSALGAAAVAAYCKGQLAHFKTPAIVCFVDPLPMTPSGKVQKYLRLTDERTRSHCARARRRRKHERTIGGTDGSGRGKMRLTTGRAHDN